MRILTTLFTIILVVKTQACEAPRESAVLSSQLNGRTMEWTFSRAILNDRGGWTSGHYQGYLQWIAQNTDLDARGLIGNQIRVYRNVLADRERRGVGNSGFDQQIRLALLDSEDMLADRLGRFRPVKCVEARAFEEFFNFSNYRMHYDEFYLQVWAKGDDIKTLGEFYALSGGSTGASPPLKARAKVLRENGWSFEVLLHNHPFLFSMYENSPPVSRPYQMGGNVHPSAPDIATFIREQPRQAWITNGVETIEFQREEYGLFRESQK